MITCHLRYFVDPAKLTEIYKDAGARFLMIQGVHHDNFDLWNSQYHQWNSVNLGPKRDLIGEWAKACRADGMRFGVTFHHEYTWWWWQTAFGSDNGCVAMRLDRNSLMRAREASPSPAGR